MVDKMRKAEAEKVWACEEEQRECHNEEVRDVEYSGYEER